MNKFEMILCEVLDCGVLDLQVLEGLDNEYLEFGIEEAKSMGELNINSIMYHALSYAGYVLENEVKTVSDNILEEIDELEKEGYDREELEEESRILSKFDYQEDIEQYHNFIDTGAYFRGTDELKEVLEKYCKDLFDDYEEKTGYYILD